MIRRVLVPLDGSEVAEAVLPYVEELAKRLGATVRLIRVVETTVQEMMALGTEAVRMVEAVEEARQAKRKEVGDYLARVADRLRREDIDASWQIVEGRAADAIVQVAHADVADLLALSTHGRSGLDRAVFGSVAAEVMGKVRIPMLLVKAAER